MNVLTLSQKIVNDSCNFIELNTSMIKNIDNFLVTKIAGNFPKQKESCLQSQEIMTKYQYNISSLQHLHMWNK